MKTDRQLLILKLLREKDISTQEELTAALCKAGFSVGQATVSRDIRELRLFKDTTRSGGVKYVAPPEAEAAGPLARIFRDCVVSVDSAENMLVLRTLSGMAMAVAAALDDMKFKEILGSVAGDDVVICVVRTKTAADALVRKLS
ncbi:MAG: arginine repressor [Defluviitaleaceae bacterium]|nr:arginine repressor [Defluviitaleaceae bacterium]